MQSRVVEQIMRRTISDTKPLQSNCSTYGTTGIMVVYAILLKSSLKTYQIADIT